MHAEELPSNRVEVRPCLACIFPLLPLANDVRPALAKGGVWERCREPVPEAIRVVCTGAAWIQFCAMVLEAHNVQSIDKHQASAIALMILAEQVHEWNEFVREGMMMCIPMKHMCPNRHENPSAMV